MTTSNTRQNAAEAYTAARNDIARLLDVMQMELEAHDKRAQADEKNWGFAGNLQKTRSDLINAVAFIAGMERDEIETFLKDAV